MLQESEALKLQEVIELCRHRSNFTDMLHHAEELTEGTKDNRLLVGLHSYALTACTDALRHLHRATEAIAKGQHALSFARDYGIETEEAITLNAIGNAYNMVGQPEQALTYFLQGLEIEERLNHSERKAGILHNIGTIYRYTQPEQALEYYNRALGSIPENPVTPFKGIILRSLAEYYVGYGDYSSALNYAYQALDFFDTYGYESHVPIIRNIIGLVYWELNELDNAESVFLQSLELCRTIQTPFALKQVLVMLAHIYSEKRHLDEAVKYYEEALEVTDEEDYTSKANIENGLAAVEFYRENYDTAEKGFRRVLEILAIDNKDPGLEAIAKQMTARCLLVKKTNTEEAQTLLTSALEKAKTINNTPIQLSIRDNFDELFILCGDYKQAYENHVEIRRLVESMRDEAARDVLERKETELKEMERTKQLALAKERENILNNILPEEITTRLIQGENPIADHFEMVSILFMDIVDFTYLSSKISAQQLVHLLNNIFTAADGVMRKFGMEKIKTIGDAYMAVAGAPVVQDDHAQRAAKAALRLLDVMQNLVVTFPEELGDRAWIESLPEIEVRIGLHCGPVAAGVVGENKFLYDLWGDAVNTASRMESHGEAGKIHVSEEFRNAVVSTSSTAATLATDTTATPHLEFIERGEIEIKGKGIMRTYFLERPDGNG